MPRTPPSFEQFLSDFAAAVSLGTVDEVEEGRTLLLEAQRAAESAVDDVPAERRTVSYRYEVALRIYAEQFEGARPSGDGARPAGTPLSRLRGR